jgi:hypothetical protein
MKHNLTIIIILFFCKVVCNAQTTGKKSNNNAFSIELGKTGLIFNLSFDHKFPAKNFGYRINIGSNFAKYLNAFSTGGGGYYLFGQKKNYFELGIDLSYLNVYELSDDQKGFILLTPDYSIKTFYASMNLGYRKYGDKGLFRIGISPGFIRSDFLPGGYISYGFIL